LKVAYDARMIDHSGIGIRIQNLLKKLPLYLPQDIEITLFGNREKLVNHGLDKFYKIIDYDPKIYSVSELLGTRKFKNYDIIDVPHFNIPVLYSRKSIVTIHDLIPWKLKEFFPSKIKRIYLYLIFHIIKFFAKKVITVSEYTKKDLVSEFRFQEAQISVIYNGINDELFRIKPIKEINDFKKKYKLPKEFFLTVGIGKEHKNIDFVIKSLKPLWLSEELKTPLVLAGANGKIPDYLHYHLKGIEKFIFVMPHLDLNELPNLYQAAKLLIYPSLYEGFGFPLLEAQAMNCQIISSDASVLPEILNNTVPCFNPRDKDDFLNKLNLLLKEKPKSSERKLKFRENLSRFSWERSAQKQIRAYEEARFISLG
jgi:glycosyltransferase involved in cell wall biosynthesis